MRTVHSLPQGRRYSSVAEYITRLGLYLHRHDELLNKANSLPTCRSDSETAVIMEVSKLKSFCVCL